MTAIAMIYQDLFKLSYSSSAKSINVFEIRQERTWTKLKKVGYQKNQSSKRIDRNSITKPFVTIDKIATFKSGYFNAKALIGLL